jgi:diaminopimelate decarboxylase
MTDLIRPALYEAYHEIRSVGEAPAKKAVDVVGPVCETGDFLGLNRKLPELKAGDLIWVENAGAYGSIMSSHYNSRPKTAEVLVEKNRHRLIRKREKVSDLWTAEKGTGSWKSVRA